MKATRSFLSSGLFAATLTALAAPALAQGPCGPMWDHQGDPATFQKNMAQRMEQRMNRLHDVLKLTPEQEPAWKTYVGKMQPPSPPAFDREAWNKLTTPERMEKMQEQAAARQQRMSEHLAAVKEFYAVLTPEQKKIFDSHFFQPWNNKGGKRGARSGMGPGPGMMGPGMGSGMGPGMGPGMGGMR